MKLHRMFVIILHDFSCSICFLVTDTFCETLTKCTETGGKCKSLRNKGIHCECWDDIVYDDTNGCEGNAFHTITYIFILSDIFYEKRDVYLQLI